MSDVETTKEERDKARETEVLIIKILEIHEKQKAMRKWKYSVVDNRGRTFLMQTSIKPRELPITFKHGRRYLVPISMNKSGAVGNIDPGPDGKFMELIEVWEEGNVSTLPLEEQAKLDQIMKPPDMSLPDMTVPEPPANDKPDVFDGDVDVKSGGKFVLLDKNKGSQLVEVPSVDVGLPSQLEVLEYIKMYEFVKKNIVNESDYQKIGNKKFLKKSGFRKFIQAFKLSLEILEKNETVGKLGIEYEVVARCTAPNGQFVDAVAICQAMEKNGNRSKHDTLTTAMTRAKSRAISDLVAFGEVSAEEVQ